MRRKEANNLHKYILIPTINDRAINFTWRTILFEGGFLINFIPLPRVFTLSLYSIIDKTNYLQMIFPKCILMPTTDDRAFNFTWRTIFESGFLINFIPLPRVFTLSLYSIIDKTNYLQMIFPKCILMPTTDDRAFNFTWHTIFEGGILINFVSFPRVFTLSLYSIIDKTNSLQIISGSGTGWWNLVVPILQLNSINLTQKGGTRRVVRVKADRQHSLSQN